MTKKFKPPEFCVLRDLIFSVNNNPNTLTTPPTS